MRFFASVPGKRSGPTSDLAAGPHGVRARWMHRTKPNSTPHRTPVRPTPPQIKSGGNHARPLAGVLPAMLASRGDHYIGPGASTERLTGRTGANRANGRLITRATITPAQSFTTSNPDRPAP